MISAVSALVGAAAGAVVAGSYFRKASKSREALHRATEDALHRQNAFLQALFDSGGHAMFSTDTRGVITSFNAVAESLFGCRASDMLGRKASEALGHIHVREEIEARRRKLAEKYGRTPRGMELFTLPLQGPGFSDREWTLIGKEGRRFPAAMTVSPLHGAGGEFHGHMAVILDITERRAFERMKSEFISTVSHELRTPLTSIRGALGLAASGATGALPPKAGELIAIAHRNSERLVRIINDILDAEKIESGNLSLHMSAIEAGAVLRQAAEANAAFGEKFGVRFVVKEAPSDAWISADPDRMMQILANLLSNAAKFSPAGAEVWLGATASAEGVRFFVRDFGPGIPAEFQPRIFGKFAQADSADVRRHVGTGLGLSISRNLVEAMGGAIGFDTEAGRGTEFFFELPRIRAQVPAAEQALPANSRRLRVLVCEDDRDVATLLTMMLERAGFEVEAAHTLAHAREKLRHGKYAAMTLDLALPDGNGLDLLHELRGDPDLASLPVVIVSACADEGRDGIRGDAIGVVDWIGKPIDGSALVDALRRGLAGRQRPRVLHVEDDPDLVSMLGHALGDEAEWVGASTLEEAESRLREERFDLVVLDLELPDGSGLGLLQSLNRSSGPSIPVLILSASESAEAMRAQVAGVLVKSRMSEERVVNTILSLIQSRTPQRVETGASGIVS